MSADNNRNVLEQSCQDHAFRHDTFKFVHLRYLNVHLDVFEHRIRAVTLAVYGILGIESDPPDSPITD